MSPLHPSTSHLPPLLGRFELSLVPHLNSPSTKTNQTLHPGHCCMMRQALDAFLPFGILQDDSKLDNYHLVGDKIMVVDLERVSDGLTDKQFISSLIESEVKRLAQFYKEHQFCLWVDGFVTIDE